MQVVENWAWVTCRLEAVHDAGQVTELEVTVESTGPVPGFPDLLARYVGERVHIRLGTRPDLLPGSRFRIKARVAGPHAIWGSADTVAAAD